MVHFSKIFFSKNSKNLCHFSKNSKKIRKKICVHVLLVDIQMSSLHSRLGPFFENIFFEKFEKSLPFFKKIRKKFEKKFASQINEFKNEDVSVSNGVLILKKGCKKAM
jgi:hypothetical protein